MPSLPFVKMHGLGNDFVVIDGLTVSKAEFARQKRLLKPKLTKLLCDRRFGIGADQILWIQPPRTKGATATMEVVNADGSRAEMCGNGIRAVALYLDTTLPKSKRKKAYPIDTGAGLLSVEMRGKNVRVNMGIPKLGSGPEKLTAAFGTVEFFDVNMGNPHAVILVDDPWAHPVEEHGSVIEKNPRFPNRTNVEFISASADGKALTVRVWERGAGTTLACGTGACASAVAAIAQGKCQNAVEVKLPGGSLKIEWKGPGEPVYMTGPAEEVYRGEWNL